jgi:hydrogenase/urease accessory protein HupE
MLAGICQAHELSTSYLTIKDSEETINGEIQLRFLDIERKLEIDANEDGKLTWGETLAHQEQISLFLTNSLQLKASGTTCTISPDKQWKVDGHLNENYLVIPFNTNCDHAEKLTIHYSGFFDQDSNHKLLVNASINNQLFNGLINKDQQEITLGKNNSWLTTAKDFTIEGIIHIWIGIDHILFLLCLLLACTLYKQNKQYFSSILIIVSLFTLAHSITLTAMSLGWIQFSSRWIEVGIAATVLFSALNNIIQMSKRVYLLTFCFGLLHGLGFASVLGELGIPNYQPWIAVVFFNLGVEIGQVAIVLMILPLLILARRLVSNFQFWLKMGSAIIALISINWVFQRI